MSADNSEMESVNMLKYEMMLTVILNDVKQYHINIGLNEMESIIITVVFLLTNSILAYYEISQCLDKKSFMDTVGALYDKVAPIIEKEGIENE